MKTNSSSSNHLLRSSTADYSSAKETSDVDQLAERLAQEMAEAWRSEKRVYVEDVLQANPSVGECRDVVLRLLCEEMCLRNEAGDLVSEEDYARRFPQWKDELHALIECQQLFDEAHKSQATRVVGEVEFTVDADGAADFEIVQELGQGAQGQVFLARQRSLSDRPIVLKITDESGFEHLSLARLQHTNIVPLYWVHYDHERNRRILCMPYFGSLSMADFLSRIEDKPLDARTGFDILNALDDARNRSAVPLPKDGPARAFFAKATDVQVVCWIGACLADALHYAHERGLVHLDVKPSNVLLANDGQPMLLDFHLAREPLAVDGNAPRGLGGTPAYMSPEQRAALIAVNKSQAIKQPVDQRSDVYSLGLILLQLLGGSLKKTDAPLRFPVGNAVSPGLAGIVHKCVSADPDNRYTSAAELAADLRRHMADQPLKGVPNRSWSERWRKWRRRRPHALQVAVLSILLLAGAMGGGYWFLSHRNAVYEQQVAQIEQHWQTGSDHFQSGRYAEAAGSLQDGLKAATNVDDRAWTSKLARLLNSAKRRDALNQLHAAVDTLRFAASQQRLSSAAKRNIASMCKKLWASRTQLLRLAEQDVSDWSEQAKDDLLDVILIWTPFRIEAEIGDDKKQVLDDIAIAARLFGGSTALAWEQARLSQSSDKLPTNSTDGVDSHSTWESMTLGRALLLAGQLKVAQAHLDRAVEMRPHEFWPNYYQGVCAFAQEDHVAALSAFRACIVAKPHSAAVYFNRGLVYANLGNDEKATKDYDAAIRIDASFGPAYLHRGVLHLKRREPTLALSVFHQAMQDVNSAATAHFNAALAYRELGQLDQTRLHLQKAIQLQPEYPEARNVLAEIKSDSP